MHATSAESTCNHQEQINLVFTNDSEEAVIYPLTGKKIAQGTPQELISTHKALNLEDLFLKLTGNKLRD